MTIDLNTANIRRTVSTIDTIARVVGRYGLVVVIAWIGALKFTAYEAQGIQPLVANSPFMSWLYDIFPVNTFSAMLGAVEITTAVLLAINPRFPRLSVLGSVLATGLFLATITFLFTTPGVGEASAGGFPVLSSTGQFLIKDVALLDCHSGHWPTLSARERSVQTHRRAALIITAHGETPPQVRKGPIPRSPGWGLFDSWCYAVRRMPRFSKSSRSASDRPPQMP